MDVGVAPRSAERTSEEPFLQLGVDCDDYESRSRRFTPPPELSQALPYVMTVVALVLVSSRAARLRFGAPSALGLPYIREEG